jgi:hypothetical protein
VRRAIIGLEARLHGGGFRCRNLERENAHFALELRGQGKEVKEVFTLGVTEGGFSAAVWSKDITNEEKRGNPRGVADGGLVRGVI